MGDRRRPEVPAASADLRLLRGPGPRSASQPRRPAGLPGPAAFHAADRPAQAESGTTCGSYDELPRIEGGPFRHRVGVLLRRGKGFVECEGAAKHAYADRKRLV